MINKLNELYLPWLEAQVNYEYRHNCRTSYRQLIWAMREKPFPWTIPNDDNRIEDGLELRYLFLTDENLVKDFQAVHFAHSDLEIQHGVAGFRSQPCSVLEVLIALSKKLAFQAEGEAGWWAWRLICNLDLQMMRDLLTDKRKAIVDEYLERLVWRTYTWDGVGGFFPLQYPKEDQRKVEIWYQMSAYLEEFKNN
jgi:hypothetical protein